MGFFQDDRDVRIVLLTDWLNWTGAEVAEQFVALPMIQRGSVWQPHQIIDLWDSLLQGMPIGSMMVSELKEGADVRRAWKPKREFVPAGGGLGLIDGQQRTLAMLVAWPDASKMDRRIWVDFADEPASGQLLRLRVTTENQPFSFQRNEPSRKLSLDDRRKAREAFQALDGEQNEPHLYNARPFSHDPGLSVDLRQLVGLWQNKSSCEDWLGKVNETLRCLKGAKFLGTRDAGAWNEIVVWEMLDEDQKAKALDRLKELATALLRLDRLEMPLIRVHERFFETKGTETSDPPLAVLFKRIGTGGTPLSDADYVYSVIKHLRPETYDFVETLHHENKNVASLLTATNLVMSAVRLAAVIWEPVDRRPVPDLESPSKRDFHRLLQRGDFINDEFLPLIEPTESGVKISRYFDSVQTTLQYLGGCDTGLPKQAFPLLNRPLVQVLLRLAQVGYLDDVGDLTRRKDVLRLVLFWLVAVTDAPKASRLAYEVIKEKFELNVELGRAIHDRLVEEWAAVRLAIPDDIKTKSGLALSPPGSKLLRGEARFNDSKKQGDEGHTGVYEFYRNHWWRPWTHQHPILLWLQREMVSAELDSKTDPMAGKDEDTPYDYDHILPYDHWGNWTGVKKGDRLLDFADRQIWVVGNGIGNLRVWGSGLNRADGNKPPVEKLKLYADLDDIEHRTLLKYSCIHVDEIDNWRMASGKESYRSWSCERALAFQSAVEMRAFHLYQRYFNELEFAEWQEVPTNDFAKEEL